MPDLTIERRQVCAVTRDDMRPHIVKIEKLFETTGESALECMRAYLDSADLPIELTVEIALYFIEE